jgi:hypothetical protein
MNQEEEFLLLLIIVVLIAWKQALNKNFVVKYKIPFSILFENFDLDQLDDEYVRRFTRFSKNEIRTLSNYFELDKIQWRHKYKSHSDTAMCLLFIRLAWSKRLFILTHFFHKSESFLSSIFNDVILYLYERYRDIIQWHSMINNYKRLRRYAKAINRELEFKELCFWEFIDETFREVARSLTEQNEMYFDYKKEHDIKFQNELYSIYWLYIHIS